MSRTLCNSGVIMAPESDPFSERATFGAGHDAA